MNSLQILVFFFKLLSFLREVPLLRYTFSQLEKRHPTDGEKKREKNSQVKNTEEKLF